MPDSRNQHSLPGQAAYALKLLVRREMPETDSVAHLHVSAPMQRQRERPPIEVARIIPNTCPQIGRLHVETRTECLLDRLADLARLCRHRRLDRLDDLQRHGAEVGR